MNTIVALSSDLGENFLFGGKVALIGILIVFVLLLLLVFILQIFRVMYKTKFDIKLENAVNNLKAKIKGKIKRKPKDIPQVEADVASVAPQIVVDGNVDYNQTVAAIVGALSVILADDCDANPEAQFIVRKIKKLEFRR